MTSVDYKNNVPKPRLIAFEVTRRCRFNCRHCRAKAVSDVSPNELTTSQCKKIMSSVADFGKCVIILTGGEPMERGDVYELISHGRNLGCRMVMATCGYAITGDSIHKLREAGIMALSFSIDGATAKAHDDFRQTPGAYDTVINAARIAREAGVRFQINMTISKINIHDVSAVAEVANGIGAYCFNPFILVPMGRGEQLCDEMLSASEYENLLNDLAKIKRQYPMDLRVTCGPQFARLCKQKDIRDLSKSTSGCMGARGFGFISHKGDVQTCGFLDIIAGNMVQNNFDFEKIWTESEFFNEIRSIKDYKGKCGKCKYITICGGCRARAYAIKGDYMASDPVCDYIPRAEN